MVLNLIALCFSVCGSIGRGAVQSLYLQPSTDILAELLHNAQTQKLWGGDTLFRYALIIVISTVLMLPAGWTTANETSSLYSKSWTHVNGNSANLELLEIKQRWVKFKKTDGTIWTMPTKDLIESDRTIAIEMDRIRNFRVSTHAQDTDLENVRTNFQSIKTENPELYKRLSDLAEYPIEDYDIEVNDEGIYYLQFFLKEGLDVDGEVEQLVTEQLNAANFGDEITFRLSQIPQEVEEDVDEVISEERVPTLQADEDSESTSLDNAIDDELLSVEAAEPAMSDSVAMGEAIPTMDASPMASVNEVQDQWISDPAASDCGCMGVAITMPTTAVSNLSSLPWCTVQNWSDSCRCAADCCRSNCCIKAVSNWTVVTTDKCCAPTAGECCNKKVAVRRRYRGLLGTLLRRGSVR